MVLRLLSSADGRVSSTWISCTRRWPIRSPLVRNWKRSPLRRGCVIPDQILAALLMNVGRDAFHRNYKLAAQSFRREIKPGLAAELCGNASFDELGTEPSMLRLDHRRPALFKPLDAQNLPVVVGAYRLPLNFNAASGDG